MNRHIEYIINEIRKILTEFEINYNHELFLQICCMDINTQKIPAIKLLRTDAYKSPAIMAAINMVEEYGGVITWERKVIKQLGLKEAKDLVELLWMFRVFGPNYCLSMLEDSINRFPVQKDIEPTSCAKKLNGN